MSFLQWNCRGYKANFEEIKSLIREKLSPFAICLQESFHGECTPFPPRGYKIYSANSVVESAPNTKPPRGVLTLIRNDIPHCKINIDTELETIAIRIKASREYTICNIYMSPTEVINVNEISNLI